MEVVRLSGYIADEKRQIARTYLEKVARERSGIGEGESTISDAAMTSLIEDYCREAGVRNLQKHLEKIYRKVALKLAKAKGPKRPSESATRAPRSSPRERRSTPKKTTKETRGHRQERGAAVEAWRRRRSLR